MTAQDTPVRVLVVDDDAMSRDLLALLLEAEGYAVKTAGSGNAALASLEEPHAAPAIVLADIQMPGLSGRLLAERLRSLCGPATLLLAMSGSAPAADAIRPYDAFLLKPFTIEQFAQLAQLSAADSSPIPQTGQSAPVKLQPDAALDETIYAKLTQTMQPDQLHQLYDLCLKDARTRILALRAAAVDGDTAAFIQQAHAIKGSAGMLGATEIYSLASNLESNAFNAPGLNLASASDIGEAGSLLPKSVKKVNPLDDLSLACDRLERILLARATPAVPTG
jgi:CheY-like chemotaxis protein